MTTLTHKGYDYSQLSDQARDIASREAQAIKSNMTDIVRRMIDTGQRLIAVKEAMPHGAFGDWISQEFGMSHKTANRFMAAAEKFGKFDTVTKTPDLPMMQSAIYLLSGDDVPEDAREEAVERAQEGERITKAVAQDIAAKHTTRRDVILSNYLAELTPEETNVLTQFLFGYGKLCQDKGFFIAEYEDETVEALNLSDLAHDIQEKWGAPAGEDEPESVFPHKEDTLPASVFTPSPAEQREMNLIAEKYGIDVIMSGKELWTAQTKDGTFLAMTNTIGLLGQKVHAVMQPDVVPAEPAEPAEPVADTFSAGDIVVWSSKDGEKVGRVEVSFGNKRIQLTIPHNTLDQTNAPYVEPARCRIATAKEIAEAEALQELEELINQTYHTGMAVKEKANLADDEGTHVVVYRSTGVAERLEAANYQDLLKQARGFVHVQRDKARSFANVLQDVIQDGVLFIDWKPDAAGDIRVLYRLDGELWTSAQLLKLSNVVHRYIQEYEDRLKERNNRIKELENLLAATEEELKDLEAAFKRLEQQEMAA